MQLPFLDLFSRLFESWLSSIFASWSWQVSSVCDESRAHARRHPHKWSTQLCNLEYWKKGLTVDIHFSSFVPIQYMCARDFFFLSKFIRLSCDWNRREKKESILLSISVWFIWIDFSSPLFSFSCSPEPHKFHIETFFAVDLARRGSVAAKRRPIGGMCWGKIYGVELRLSFIFSPHKRANHTRETA